MSRGRDEPGICFDEGKDLLEVWPQVVLQYEMITKQKVDSKTTFNSFQINVDREISNSKSRGHEHARQVLRNIGKCLETFGSIIAQDASMVLVRHLNVGTRLALWYKPPEAFFRRLNNFLEHKRGVGEADLPLNLRKPAYDILVLFLDVLRSSYELVTSKREKCKVIMKIVLFNDDSGVASALGLMEQRIRDFTNASVDEILLDVKGPAHYLHVSEEERIRHQAEIQEHVEASYGRNTKEQHDEAVEKIRKRLTPQQSIKQVVWDQRHNELCESRVKVTGKWLERRGLVFTEWADASQHGKNLFLVRGDSGFGKTYISNYAISYLQNEHCTENRPTQVYIAYYYYGADKDDSLEKCLGSIIYQFAIEDMGYAKAVANACGRPEATVRAGDRWTHLVQRLQNHMKGTYFICIDGIDEYGQPEEMTATISAIGRYIRSQDVSNGVCLRLFMSGSYKALSAMTQDIGNVKTRESSLRHVGKLDSPRLNAADIKTITRARVVDACDIKPDLKGILNELNIQILLDSIRGNYARLEAKLAAIIACNTEREVSDVITNSADDVSTFQRNSLKALDSSLDSAQIHILNELLVWVSGTLHDPSARFLQSALYFDTGEKYFLESEIATTYSTLLKIDESGRVSFKSDDIKDILRASSASNPDPASGDPSTEQISRAEVDLCRRFIKNACDSFDYTRFKFDEFFDALVHKSHIRLDDGDTVNVAIIRSCVDALYADRKDKNLRELRSYAANNFCLHIKNLMEKLDNFDADRHFLTDTGAKVLDLFYEPDRIDAWIYEISPHQMKTDWLHSNVFFDTLLVFLKNPHVMKGYTRDARKGDWVKSIIVRPANKMLLLERVAARLARRWFSSTTCIHQDYFLIPYGLVVKQSGDLEEFWTPSGTAPHELRHYLQWAETHFGCTIDNHTWQYRVGESWLASGHYEEAILAFKETEPHMQNNWSLAFSSATVYGQLNDFRTSLRYIQKFKALSDQYWKSDKGFREAHWKLLLAESNCYRQLQDYESAVKGFTGILSQDLDEEPNSDYIRVKALEHFWREVNPAGHGSIYWLWKFAWNDKIHGYIVIASKHTGVVEEMCALYQAAIDCLISEPASDDPHKAFLQYLKYFQGALRFHASCSQIDHDRGIRLWEDLVWNSGDMSGYPYIAYKASQMLAPCLLDKAIVEDSMPPSTPSASYVSRLETLTRMDSKITRCNRQGKFDPRLCLARLYHVKGNRDLAFVQAQERFCSVFDKWPENAHDDSLELRYKNLASTLTVLEQDADAVAAWQAIRPRSNLENADSVIINDKEFTSKSTPAPSDISAPIAIGTNGDKKASLVEGRLRAYISRYGCDGLCDTK
ncbi:hypothetical protein G6514_001534 [Epicoccum nigrum]|nr:hypothetical protein G6514_001534 [Epicoccum nigrum]